MVEYYPPQASLIKEKSTICAKLLGLRRGIKLIGRLLGKCYVCITCMLRLILLQSDVDKLITF